MENKVVNRSNIRRSNPIAMLKKNAMLIILVLVYIFFTIMTKGRMFKPTSFASLINQNAYVYILGCGMLMCMLTGGNIDLSCGAFVCLLGSRADRVCDGSAVDRDPGRLSGLPRPGHVHTGRLFHELHIVQGQPGFPEDLLRNDVQDA